MKINLDRNEARRKEKTIAKERHDIYILHPTACGDVISMHNQRESKIWSRWWDFWCPWLKSNVDLRGRQTRSTQSMIMVVGIYMHQWLCSFWDNYISQKGWLMLYVVMKVGSDDQERVTQLNSLIPFSSHVCLPPLKATFIPASYSCNRSFKWQRPGFKISYFVCMNMTYNLILK
jgi:hypothetical protein